MTNQTINVVVAGAQGYVGKALVNLILDHPHLHLVAVSARASQASVYAAMPSLAEHQVAVIATTDLVTYAPAVDVVLLATPPKISIECVLALQDHRVKLIDLSGAFRLSANEFAHWYGMSHQAPELLDEVHYGLSPWNLASGEDQQLISNPGCYATTALMALIPLLQAGVIEESNIIIDAKSGVSGAGKNVRADLMFAEMAANFFPYKVGKHQHTPEINNALTQFSGKQAKVILTTHMLPILRGISMTIYGDARQHFPSDQEVMTAIGQAFAEAYQGYPLLQYVALNQDANADCGQETFILSLTSVVGTAKTHISYFVKAGKVFIFSCIDNLLKGAASQAIENINALYDFPLATGLVRLRPSY